MVQSRVYLSLWPSTVSCLRWIVGDHLWAEAKLRINNLGKPAAALVDEQEYIVTVVCHLHPLLVNEVLGSYTQRCPGKVTKVRT
jgi:hypothetical protein